MQLVETKATKGGKTFGKLLSRMKRPFHSINLPFNTSSLWCNIITNDILTSCHALSAIFLADVTTAKRYRQTVGRVAVKRSDTCSTRHSQDIVS